MTITRVGDWLFARRLVSTASARIKGATERALQQEAQFFRTKIVEGIREQAPGGRTFRPLAPTTLAVRRLRGFRGTKALLVRGDLRNAISVVRQDGGLFVGVLRTAKGKRGQSLVNVAAVHEFGSRPIVVRLTPKARRFLHAALRRAGIARGPRGRGPAAIVVVRIPARPFLRPVFDRYGRSGDQVARRFLGRVARLLASDFGAAPFVGE